MDYGWTAPSEAAARRRFSVSRTAPKATWDVPDGWDSPGTASMATGGGGDPGWGGEHAAGSYSSTGDPLLDRLRNTSLMDASARVRGARTAAQASAPNDPAAAAFADLAAYIGGQGQSASDLNHLGASYGLQQQQQGWQEHMARLEAELRRKQIEEMNKNSWLGDLTGLVGSLGGAYLGGL